MILRPLFFTLLLSIAFTLNAQQTLPFFEKVKKPIIKPKKGQAYTFGYLNVPENRSNPESNTIKLPVYIFPSRNPKPSKGPIIYLVGGPGSSIMGAVPYMNYYQYLNDRDFILLEQRGTKYAQPSLDCPEWAKALYQSQFPAYSKDQKDRLLLKAAKDCSQKLKQQGIDLSGYNTQEIAADVAALKNVLKFDEYNLLTLSYGTKIAQTIMRDFPEGLRSVVMDSPLPIEVNYDEESIENLVEVWSQLLDDCDQDPDCAHAYPQLKERFFEFLTAKTKAPLILNIQIEGKSEHFALQGKDLLFLLGTSSTSEIPNIPWRINQVIVGDYTWIKEQIQGGFSGAGSGIGQGMRMAVWCAEEFPFASKEKIKTEAQKYPMIKGAKPNIYDAEICACWSNTPRPPKENEPILSDIPVLLISGSYDEQTPVKWAKAMLPNLKNAYHLVFPGWQHGPTTYWDNPCAMEAANSFFNNPTQIPQLDCWTKLKSVKFKTP